MNKITTLGAIIPLVLLILPNHVLALSDQERYNIGWQSGVSQSQYDWNNNIPYEPNCPKYHSDSFCLAYQEGYVHWWKSAQQQITQGTEQNAAVNIRGNGNHVTVNQQSNNRAGSSEGDGGGSGGANP